jgi:hypothetical protein
VLPLCSRTKVKGRRKYIRLQLYDRILSLFQDLDCGIAFNPCVPIKQLQQVELELSLHVIISFIVATLILWFSSRQSLMFF